MTALCCGVAPDVAKGYTDMSAAEDARMRKGLCHTAAVF